ncbi:polyprenyl diphosphate synthase [Mesoterricola silvestris]|uniref:Isoprenyl transferase n=1 Tax=Mesoterricola silvestris TaxID=2927979 RepID=A0AA48GNJ5_9BACT|nr:polyprenyl diphosphate synthase [Mesoterricola silvestris]BDU74604.1 isoprenyl transferase [Mesoterricola silvestris]
MTVPRHVALIMDGNGRWAAQRGWPRIKGHKEGVRAVQDILDAASDAGIGHLTLYAFSTENWKRPAQEVAVLMALLRMYLRMFLPKLRKRGIRFHHLGAPEGLPGGILKDLRTLEEQTAGHTGMVFHLAVNYGARLELATAARKCLEDGVLPADLDEEALASRLWTAGAPDVDLLIRTSGELRISNFLLWQAAYAEFYMTECLWPDFRGPQLREALEAYSQRERRFGGI